MSEESPIAPLMKAAKKLDEKVDVHALTGERRETHGDWIQQSADAQRLKAIIYERCGNLQPYEIEALDMICVKISRILNGSRHPDHWRDIQGYAHLGMGG